MSRTSIRSLSTCTFDQALELWNAGFQGYRVNMTRSMEAYLARFHDDGLSPELSLVAFAGGEPAGFLLNGIRQHADKKVAWNGGTAVRPEFRGQGIGKLLVRAALDLYKEQSVEVATLEALSDNKSAIGLYESFGYRTVDRLLFLQHDGALKNNPFGDSSRYTITLVPPAAAGALPMYDADAAWPTQWQNIAAKGGEAAIAHDDNGETIGYALFTTTLSEAGAVPAITLYQCVVAPGRNDAENVFAALLNKVYAPGQLKCRRSTFNLSARAEIVTRQLTSAGFTLFIDQFHMVAQLRHSDV